MGTEQLQWSISSVTVQDPVEFTGVATTLTVTNAGDSDLTDLGIYIAPTTDSGQYTEPLDVPPATAYQKLLQLGSDTDAGLVASGGLIISAPQNGGGTFNGYVTQTVGATIATKIPIEDIPSGGSIDIDVTNEAPAAATAERLYVDIFID